MKSPTGTSLDEYDENAWQYYSLLELKFVQAAFYSDVALKKPSRSVGNGNMNSLEKGLDKVLVVQGGLVQGD